MPALDGAGEQKNSRGALARPVDRTLWRGLMDLAPAPDPRAPHPAPARASRSGEGEPEAREKRSALPTFGDKTSAPRSPSARRPSAPPDRPDATPTVPTPAPTSRSP